MLRLIAGFEKPSSGEIYIGDKLVSSENNFYHLKKRNWNGIPILCSMASYECI